MTRADVVAIVDAAAEEECMDVRAREGDVVVFLQGVA